MYQAVQRLQSLATKMRRNPEFACDYTEFMEKLITDGHAEVVPENEIERPDGKVWYLPHHGVYHAKKNKIRVVFDCAATYQGSSLNNRLLQGPDLTNNLIGVLLRFRQGIYAAQGDIQSMFYMVNVPRSDTDYLRFLWWPDGNVKKGPAIYRMLKHSFGLRSSPSCANSALRRTALDNVMNFDELVFKTVLNNFYVDDCLRSHDDKDQLMKLVKDLRLLCSKGGFRLSKWISNDREILSSVPVEDRAKNVVELNLDYEELPVERALGITWNVESDVLKFDVALKPQPYTRRGILATIGSVYDPLGLVSPFLLAAKLILQNLCRLELGWDDQIPETDLRKWQLFLESLPGLERFDIPRCYKPKNFGRIISSQIHSFADASTEGYGMVAYLRFVNESEDIYCSLLFGKARVAPLKKMTIPRMELTAATIAVRLTNMVLRELEIHVDQVFYHTDSMSVLRYLRNTSSRFLTFVANRIAVIRDGSDISQWYYVDTKNNPADQASRGVKADNLNQVKKWFHGPDFLWKPNYEWPEQKDLSPMLPEDDPELRIVCSTTADTSITDQLLSRFSSWDKLRRVVARLLICFEILRERVRRRLNSTCTLDAVPQQTNITKQFDQPNSSADGFLTPEDIEKAESAIIRYTQYQHYNRELRTLSQHDTKATVNKNSTLRRLDPILVNGNLRVGGRLNRADIPYDEKHPLILPAQTHVSMLIVRHVHTVVGHLGKSAIMAELRQKYWIVRASSLIKSVISKCVSCRKYKARVAEQKMADLPVERLIPDQPPFSRVGMDFFGPFEVKRGRSTIKRYGVIFTCLAVRAVHLEVAYSLDTDSCISSIRRFISRRGPVKFIRSDNGTNLIGSERELREEIQDWNQAKIKNTLLQYGINWQFNPPAASHFGGVWERLIRTVRRILYALLKERLIPMDDEALHTFLCEVEAIMNCRPITTVSSDMNDINPLTPNHLLLNRSGETMPIGIFDKADNYARRRWRQIQYLSGIFWKRWTREYLQLLQVRQKWLKPHKNVAVGDVVLVVDTAIKCSYTLGRVIEVIADRNGLVRVATVKTQNSTVQRPVHKLSIVLEAD